MKVTINIPVTRKRTKHGYYVLHRSGGRLFFINKANAIEAILNDLRDIASRTSIVTARDFAKNVKGNRPPV